MDEEISIIDTNTRNEKIKNFLISNKKILIVIILTIIFLFVGYFSFEEIKQRGKIKLANQFNLVTMTYNSGQGEQTIKTLINIIKKRDDTYSPLALYFLIDNNLIENKKEINALFEILINEVNLKKEIKNLIIYKKALYNSGFVDENELIQILNPIINSKSIWKSHALYLVAEYFYSNKENQKAKEFFNQIIILPDANYDIKLESQKRINRDFSE